MYGRQSFAQLDELDVNFVGTDAEVPALAEALSDLKSLRRLRIQNMNLKEASILTLALAATALPQLLCISLSQPNKIVAAQVLEIMHNNRIRATEQAVSKIFSHQDIVFNWIVASTPAI